MRILIKIYELNCYRELGSLSSNPASFGSGPPCELDQGSDYNYVTSPPPPPQAVVRFESSVLSTVLSLVTVDIFVVVGLAASPHSRYPRLLSPPCLICSLNRAPTLDGFKRRSTPKQLPHAPPPNHLYPSSHSSNQRS